MLIILNGVQAALSAPEVPPVSSQSLPESPSERRRVRQRLDARRSILEATEELLVELGYEGFSMRRLAKRCGYTAPTIYYHFRDKQTLIDTVCDQRFKLLLERALAVPPCQDPWETVRARLEVFARFGLENPDHYRLLSVARPDDSPPLPSGEEIRGLLELPLRELAAAGRLHSADVDEAVQFLWVTLHGLVVLLINRPHYEWSPTLVGFTLDTALRGLAERSAGAAS